jgi:hypothetical protein
MVPFDKKIKTHRESSDSQNGGFNKYKEDNVPLNTGNFDDVVEEEDISRYELDSAILDTVGDTSRSNFNPMK